MLSCTTNNSVNPSLFAVKETVLWNKDSLYNNIISHLAKAKEIEKNNPEKLNDLFSRYTAWRHKNVAMDTKCDEIWETVRKKPLINDVINEQKNITNSNIIEYNEILHANKETVILGLLLTKTLAATKPLGSAGVITINEIISKGLDVIDTPLVQMIRNNGEVSVIGGYISSMILYKSIVNLFASYIGCKFYNLHHSAYNKTLPDSLFCICDKMKSKCRTPSTRTKEIALFMLMGAPFVAGCMWSVEHNLGTNTIANANNELEGIDSNSKTEIEGTSTIRRNYLFLLLNKLPSWLKIILKYILYYFIGLFIIKVIGYNSNIIEEIYSQFDVYLGYYLKFFCILNFFVIIYFSWKLFVIVMYAHNKEYINPEAYPNFIKNELLESKTIAINLYLKNPGVVYKHYLRLIFLYSSIVLIGLIVIVLHSMYLIP